MDKQPYNLNECIDDTDYQRDCKIKKVLRTIINHHPSSWQVVDYEICNDGIMVDPDKSNKGGIERKVYSTIKVEIELVSELIFDDKKKLIKY